MKRILSNTSHSKSKLFEKLISRNWKKKPNKIQFMDTETKPNKCLVLLTVPSPNKLLFYLQILLEGQQYWDVLAWKLIILEIDVQQHLSSSKQYTRYSTTSILLPVDPFYRALDRNVKFENYFQIGNGSAWCYVLW